MRKGKPDTFLYRMRYSLRYRLMTAALVCILPMAVVGCVLMGLVWTRSERALHASEQARLEEAMAYWERDSVTVDSSMAYFVSLYLEELNADTAGFSEITPYRMLAELKRILPAADHSGLAALRSNDSRRVLALMSDPGADALTIDTQVRGFCLLTAADEDLPDNSWQEVAGRHYLLKRYDYHNYSVFFALDVGNSILERTAALRDSTCTVYVADGDRVFSLTASGPLSENRSWAECTAPGLGRSTVFWQSETLPIAVCIAAEQSIFSRVPSECWLLLAVVVICLANSLTIWRIIRLEVLDPTRELTRAMRELQSGNLDIRLENDCCRNSDDVQYLFDTFDEMADEVQASREKDRRMYQAEMDNLRLQLNPHMLLNSLNTIYSLAQLKKYDAIQDYSLHLTDYFRYALRTKTDLVTVQQELDFIHTYMEIQKIRYPGALSFVYSMDDDCAGAKVPPLLIQNFVENSIKYGVKRGRVTEILVNIHRRENRLEISVTDTGAGMRHEVLEQLRTGQPYVDALGQKHIGIWNCRRRIEVFFGEDPKLEIVSGEGGTQVFLDIPFVKEAVS